MKPNQVNKLYAKLTPCEQANLVFEAVLRQDESTITAILGHVERKHYSGPDTDYVGRMYGLTALVGQYGIEYWKNRTLMLVASESAETRGVSGERIAMRFFDKVLAVEAAILSVCDCYGVDVMTVKVLAGCPFENVNKAELPDEDNELVREYVEAFTTLLSG